jgi:hypothetical protein
VRLVSLYKPHEAKSYVVYALAVVGAVQHMATKIEGRACQ